MQHWPSWQYLAIKDLCLNGNLSLGMGKLTGMHVVLSGFTRGICPLTVNAGEPNEELSNSTVVKGLFIYFFNLVESLYLGEYVLSFFFHNVFVPIYMWIYFYPTYFVFLCFLTICFFFFFPLSLLATLLHLTFVFFFNSVFFLFFILFI